MGFTISIHTVARVCLAALLLTIAFVIIRSLLRRDKNADSKINIDELFLDENGKTSKVAIVFLGSFIFTTWVGIWMTLEGKMDTGLLMAYGSLWVTPVVMKVIFNKSGP